MTGKTKDQEGIDALRYNPQHRRLTHPIIDRVREECSGTNRPPAPRSHGEFALAAAIVCMQSGVGVFQCKKCGWPYVDSHSCTFCKDAEPFDSVRHESARAMEIRIPKQGDEF